MRKSKRKDENALILSRKSIIVQKPSPKKIETPKKNLITPKKVMKNSNDIKKDVSKIKKSSPKKIETQKIIKNEQKMIEKSHNELKERHEELIGEILEGEENLMDDHHDHINKLSNIINNEKFLIKMMNEIHNDLNIHDYLEKLNLYIEEKSNLLNSMKNKVFDLQQLLKEEESLRSKMEN
jgi:hypothetical protein